MQVRFTLPSLVAVILGAGLPSACGEDTTGNLVINELAAAGAPNDWFEIYNGTDLRIDLSDYSFSDDMQDRPRRSRFPQGTQVEAGGYALIYMTDTFPGFALAGDEELGLYDPDGTLLDSVDWDEGDSPPGGSLGRIPDGTGEFRTLSEPTPGGANAAD